MEEALTSSLRLGDPELIQVHIYVSLKSLVCGTHYILHHAKITGCLNIVTELETILFPSACLRGDVESRAPSTSTQPPLSFAEAPHCSSQCSGENQQASSSTIQHVLSLWEALKLLISCVGCCTSPGCSLLHQLRCSVHFELAKICAGQNQLQTALEHLHKVNI